MHSEVNKGQPNQTTVTEIDHVIKYWRNQIERCLMVLDDCVTYIETRQHIDLGAFDRGDQLEQLLHEAAGIMVRFNDVIDALDDDLRQAVEFSP